MNINNEPVWVEVKCTGEITGQEYFGRFLVKKFLTHKERGEAVRNGEALCRGIEDIAVRSFFMSLAFVSAHVIETDAPWYKDRGADLIDEQPIWSISAEIRKLQTPEKEKGKEEVKEEGKK